MNLISLGGTPPRQLNLRKVHSIFESASFGVHFDLLPSLETDCYLLIKWKPKETSQKILEIIISKSWFNIKVGKVKRDGGVKLCG